MRSLIILPKTPKKYKILIEMINIYNFEKNREGVAVSELVLASWSGLRCWWEDGATQETKTLALSLLTKLIILNSKVS